MSHTAAQEECNAAQNATHWFRTAKRSAGVGFCLRVPAAELRADQRLQAEQEGIVQNVRAAEELQRNVLPESPLLCCLHVAHENGFRQAEPLTKRQTHRCRLIWAKKG
jgi:hypothetical protein